MVKVSKQGAQKYQVSWHLPLSIFRATELSHQLTRGRRCEVCPRLQLWFGNLYVQPECLPAKRQGVVFSVELKVALGNLLNEIESHLQQLKSMLCSEISSATSMASRSRFTNRESNGRNCWREAACAFSICWCFSLEILAFPPCIHFNCFLRTLVAGKRILCKFRIHLLTNLKKLRSSRD